MRMCATIIEDGKKVEYQCDGDRFNKVMKTFGHLNINPETFNQFVKALDMLERLNGRKNQ